MSKRFTIFITCLLLIALIVTGCSSKKIQVIAPEEKEELVVEELEFFKVVKFDSVMFSENLINAKNEQKVYIYLPPSYYESDSEFPVIYYLHGFGESAGSYIGSNKQYLNVAFAEAEKQFILVEFNGGTSFYVNSPVTGKWEDYATQEIVSYIDNNFHTIDSPKSRGICGFSMGGFGALNLALLHPDIYGAVYAMSPGIIAEGKLTDALNSWKYDERFKLDYSRAFAPDTDEPYGKIPTFDGSNKDNECIAMWESGFEDWPEKLDAYLALDTPLSAIGLSCGTSDTYSWITEGTAYFSDLLNEKDIMHTSFSFEGGHIQPPNSIADHLVPFFSEALVWN